MTGTINLTYLFFSPFIPSVLAYSINNKKNWIKTLMDQSADKSIFGSIMFIIVTANQNYPQFCFLSFLQSMIPFITNQQKMEFLK